jgi:hypothetical protein
MKMNPLLEVLQLRNALRSASSFFNGQSYHSLGVSIFGGDLRCGNSNWDHFTK